MYRDLYNAIHILNSKSAFLVNLLDELTIGVEVISRPPENFSDKEKALPYPDPQYVGQTRRYL